MNQRAFSILIFLVLAAALLTQCRSSQPEERNTTLDGVADDGTPTSALFAGASSGSIDRMSAAVERGASVNARNDFNWTPLMMAVFYDQQRSVSWLIKHGAHVNDCADSGVTSLLEAARVGDEQILDDLIDAGGDIRATDSSGRNALIFSIECLHGTTVLRDLLARGLSPDWAEHDGQTPLMQAAASGKVQFADILLAHGANLHAKDHAGHTPLDLAEMSHDDPMIAFLSVR